MGKKIQLLSYLDKPKENQNSFKKSQFDQKDGQYLLNLQKQYNDDRFKLTASFKDDIDIKRVSKLVQSEVTEMNDKEYKKNKNNSAEQNNQMKILQDIIPEQKHFLQTNVNYKQLDMKKGQNFMVQRFDPSRKQCQKLVIKEEAPKKQVVVEKKIKIQKGIDKKKLNLMQGEQKLKSLQEKKVPKVIKKIKKIDYKAWKEILTEKQDDQEDNQEFKLFG